MNKRFYIGLFVLVFTAFALRGSAAELSFKEWRNQMKAAEQARYVRNFQKMREILEGTAAGAQKLGSLSSAENAYWLAVAYRNLNMHAEAIETFDKELERIGPKPTALKLQILRGLILNERSIIEFRMKDYDKAMSSAVEARSVLENAAGKYHPELFNVHRTIGAIYALQKNYPEAEKALKTALKLRGDAREIWE